jgi:hypothetical protein
MFDVKSGGTLDLLLNAWGKTNLVLVTDGDKGDTAR